MTLGCGNISNYSKFVQLAPDAVKFWSVQSKLVKFCSANTKKNTHTNRKCETVILLCFRVAHPPTECPASPSPFSNAMLNKYYSASLLFHKNYNNIVSARYCPTSKRSGFPSSHRLASMRQTPACNNILLRANRATANVKYLMM